MKKKHVIALVNSPINSQKSMDKIVTKLVKGLKDNLSLLNEDYGSPEDQEKITIVHFVLIKNPTLLVKLLKEMPELLNKKYEIKTSEGTEQCTIVHFLLTKKPAFLIKLLTEKEVDLTKLLAGADAKGRTFLHCLADAPLNKEDISELRIIIKTLLENHAFSINAIANDGDSALHKSVKAKNVLFTELLFDLGRLDINLTNREGLKAIDLSLDNPELYRIFIRYLNKSERDENLTYVKSTPVFQSFDSDYKYPSLLVTPRTNLSSDREQKKLRKHNKQKSTTALPRSQNSSGSKRNRSYSGITSDDTAQTSSTSGSSELSSNSNQFSEEWSERDPKFQPLSAVNFSFKYKEWSEAFKQSTAIITNEILQDFAKLSKEYILPDAIKEIATLNRSTSEHLTYLFITNYLNSVVQGKKADVFRKLDRIPNYFIYATLNQPDDVVLGNSQPITSTPNFEAIDLSYLNLEENERRKKLINYLWVISACQHEENGTIQRRFNKKKIADITLGLLTEFSILEICRATRNIYKQLDNDQKICANLIIMFATIFYYREAGELPADVQIQIDFIISLNNKSDSLDSPRKSTDTISLKYQIKEIMENIVSKCLMIDQEMPTANEVKDNDKKFKRDSLQVDHEIQNFKTISSLYDQLASPETLVDFNQLVTKAIATDDVHAQFELTGLVAREIKKLTITMYQELRFADLTNENSVILMNYTNALEKLRNYFTDKILSDNNPYKALNFLLELSKHILSTDSKEFPDLNFIYEIYAILISPEIYNLPDFEKLDKETINEIQKITCPLKNNANHHEFYKKHSRTLPQISFTKKSIIAAIESNDDKIERYEAMGKSITQFLETKCITLGKFIYQTNIMSLLESYQIVSIEQLQEKMLTHCAPSAIDLNEALQFNELLGLIDKKYLSKEIVPGAIKNFQYISPKKLALKLVEIFSEQVNTFTTEEKDQYYKQLDKMINKIFMNKSIDLTKNEMIEVRNKLKQFKTQIKGSKESNFRREFMHHARHTLATPIISNETKEKNDHLPSMVINLNSYSENIFELLQQINTLCQEKEFNPEFLYNREKLESILQLPSCLIAMMQKNLHQDPLSEENRNIVLRQVEKLQEIVPNILSSCHQKNAPSQEETDQIIKDINHLKDQISNATEPMHSPPQNSGLTIEDARARFFHHHHSYSEPTNIVASNTNQSPSQSND
ncbi:MAG: hypothetical protein BGO90_00530 [Legionella sp. 40-6]|nr:ankyrin repeat domain-containing protein [Legionella sp.]OJY46412.1 MAG: hypothetical protein BGO90_00530 [Legionella sp. 40-6]